ncbi:hypothetical protein Q1695_010966 [Nippostrongylus brasiliensis]|nr:hypothetical protein Q1695_010966 [Nippostrongylus brasiliensis]
MPRRGAAGDIMDDSMARLLVPTNGRQRRSPASDDSLDEFQKEFDKDLEDIRQEKDLAVRWKKMHAAMVKLLDKFGEAAGKDKHEA